MLALSSSADVTTHLRRRYLQPRRRCAVCSAPFPELRGLPAAEAQAIAGPWAIGNDGLLCPAHAR